MTSSGPAGARSASITSPREMPRCLRKVSASCALRSKGSVHGKNASFNVSYARLLRYCGYARRSSVDPVVCLLRVIALNTPASLSDVIGERLVENPPAHAFLERLDRRCRLKRRRERGSQGLGRKGACEIRVCDPR